VNENPKQKRFDELVVLHRTQEVVEGDALIPPEPPAAVLEAGGHLVLCIVSDMTSSVTSDGEVFPRISIEHFMRVVRDNRLSGSSKAAVVILSDILPSDWHSIVHYERLYWVKGSALHHAHLNRAGFRHARAIAIVRGHCGEGSTGRKVADARVLLAANLVEAHLPFDTQTVVITDHCYNGSCDFLPKTHAPIEVLHPDAPCIVGNSGQASLSRLFNSLFSGREAPTSKGTLGNAERVGDDLGIHSGPVDEDYEELPSTEYAYHSRYMRGQVFVASVMPALVANTLYNPSLIPLVDGLLHAPMVLVPLPSEWERHIYADFAIWLFNQQELLPLALYRSAQAAAAHAVGKPVDESVPTHHYVYCAPNAKHVHLIRTDRILCIAMSQTL
jgi:hypothetical protein